MKKETFIKVLEKLHDLIEPSVFKNTVYAVGGCVRDMIMGNEIHDIDLCVEMPDGGLKLANYLYKQGELTGEPVLFPVYGTSSFALKDFPDIRLEAVMTRKEKYKDKTSRNPETCYGTIYEDALRRDLTINAIYVNISTNQHFDPTNGINDIADKILKTPAAPDIIFADDPLRILRVARFSLRYPQFTVASNVIAGIYKNKYRISILKQERITEELTKMLTYPACNFESFIYTMNSFGLFEYTIPNITAAMLSDGISACNYAYINKASLPAKLMVLFTLMFIHRHKLTGCPVYDWYKVRSSINKDKVRIIVPIEIIEEAIEQLRKMKFSNEVIDKVKFYFNMYNSPELDRIDKAYDDVDYRKLTSYFRHYTSTCKNETDIMEILDIIDFLAGNIATYLYSTPERDFVCSSVQFSTIMKSQIFRKDPYKVYEMKCPVNGNDVMEITGITGPDIKRVLDACKQLYFYNPEIYNREKLLEYIRTDFAQA